MKPTLLLAIACLLLSGCGDEEILHYQVPKEKTASTPTEAAAPAASTGTTANSHNGILWTLPEGWTFEAGSGMRFGTFKFTHENTPVECTLVKLGGAAGGLAPNINRWRGQIGLKPATPEEIEKELETVEGKLGPVQVSKLVNPDNAEQAILASIINIDGATLFVKITTKSSFIEALKSDFSKFSASIHLAE